MNKKALIPLFIGSLAAASAAHAAVDLIAIGTINGSYQDFSSQTAAPLENGIAGNRLGGMGSALAYAGCNTFLALPDRGPNATTYDAALDSTASYIPRFHTVHLSLGPNENPNGLPFVLTPFLVDTTLFSSRTPLVYGTGAGLGVGSGRPALNTANHTYYFSGRSDNFDSSQLSTNPNNGRLDPEGIRVSNDGDSVFVTDEYGPYVYQFDRASGKRLRAFKLPGKFAVPHLSPVGDTEIGGNTIGRVANKGMEGLAITPDGRTLAGIMQSPLIQDGGTDAPFTRIVLIDIGSGNVKEYAYELTNIGTAAKPKYGTVSEITAINSRQFLVDERDGKGLGDNSTAAFKRLFKIDLSAAKEVSAVSGAANLAGKAVAKTLFLDVVAALNANGINSQDLPAKLEGITFGPDVAVQNVTKHTLYIANDNDYLGTVTDSNHPAGIDNPNKIFVFAFDAADLPSLTAQRLDAERSCGDDRDGRDGWWFRWAQSFDRNR